MDSLNKLVFHFNMQPTSLYIHIPWCVKKCPYCDFNSHQSPDIRPEKAYIRALVSDLKQDLMHYPARPIESIFIGGGTPSLLSAEAYDILFTSLQEIVPWSESIEITLEANPGTMDTERFKDYRALGINRLSLGIQSFNPVHLKALGRIHDDKQAHRAIDCARDAGFANINVDIMYGLPQQSIEQGVEDLQTALAHQVEHLSWYQLTLEPNTVFYKKPPSLPTEDTIEQLETLGHHLLKDHAFQRYEISAFSKPRYPSRHNLNYWHFGDYYGIGAGAHGKLTTTQGIHRTRKYRQPTDYLNLNKAFLAETTHVSPTDAVFEFMLNATRLEAPIPKGLFTERTGISSHLLEQGLTTAAAKGLLSITDTHWQVTPLGRRYTNDLQTLFLFDKET